MQLVATQGLVNLIDRTLLPAHDGLGSLVIEEPDEDGGFYIYRHCLNHWDESEQNDYMKDNPNVDFGWVETGANPIWGVYSYIYESDLEKEE